MPGLPVAREAAERLACEQQETKQQLAKERATARSASGKRKRDAAVTSSAAWERWVGDHKELVANISASGRLADGGVSPEDAESLNQLVPPCADVMLAACVDSLDHVRAGFIAMPHVYPMPAAAGAQLADRGLASSICSGFRDTCATGSSQLTHCHWHYSPCYSPHGNCPTGGG